MKNTPLYPIGLIILTLGCGGATGDDSRAQGSALDFVADDTRVPSDGASTPAPQTIDGEDDPTAGEDDGDRVDVDCRSECEFTTYNLDVVVGDSFVLDHFVDCEDGPAPYVFGYEDGEDWNLAAFNSGQLVTILRSDLDGGNKGDGEYRFSMYDAHGEELDHMTIRIGHDDRSDIAPRHAQPIARPAECAPPERGPRGW